MGRTSKGTGYWSATRHPLPCFLFVVPLLLLYESAVVFLGGPHQEYLRNGADHWVRVWMRIENNLSWFWVPTVALIFILGGWCYQRRSDAPSDLLGTLCGIGIESATLALGLWGLSRLLAPLMQTMGVRLTACSMSDPAIRQLVPYLGAGIYEEVVFRLFLFSFLYWMLRRWDLAESMSTFLAAFGSAALFSAAHHVGPNGDPYGNYVFVFRLLAGFYFALIFQFRGFGIAVGTHSCYNVIVSVGVS